MKDYLKVKEILLVQAKPMSKYNKLVKLSLTSNDSKLKELLTDLAKVYKLALTPDIHVQRVIQVILIVIL